MKRSFFAAFLPLVLALFLISGCGQDDDAEDGMKPDEIAPLTDVQVSNFIFILPVILDFSEKFHARMSDDERNSPDANERYFNALKESSLIRDSVATYGYKSVDDLLLVYKNVLLEYTTIKRNLTNDAAVAELYGTIRDYRSNYTALLGNSTLTKEEASKVRKQLNDLKNDETRYSNILLIKKYEKDLDRVSQGEK